MNAVDSRARAMDGRELASRRVRVLAGAVLLLDWLANGGAYDLISKRSIAVLTTLAVIVAINAVERRLARGGMRVALVGADVIWATTVCLASGEAQNAPWIVLVVPILTAIVYFGMSAGLITWGAVSVGYLGGLIAIAPAAADLSVFPAMMATGVRHVALLLLVAIPAGYLTEQLSLDVLTQKRIGQLAARRVGLLGKVTEHGAALTTFDADVGIILCEGVIQLGFSSADIIESRSGNWRRIAAVGDDASPLPMPAGGDELDPAFVEELRRGEATVDQTRGTVAVPLGEQDGSRLYLRATAPAEDVSDGDQKDALRLLAHQAEVAIRNGQLLDRLRELKDGLSYQATHDSLTGLDNRVALTSSLERLRGSDGWSSGSVALLLLDLDGFKGVNDRRGHEAGDELLIIIGERLRRVVGEGGELARLGGDEFTVLLPETSLDSAASVAARIVEVLGQPASLGGEIFRIGASVGVAVSAEDVQWADLLRRADVAMYQAKQAGRSQHCLYSAELDSDGLRRIQLRSDLGPAVAAGDFEIHYQALASADTSQVLGVEALLRWRHPTFGLVPPEEVIELAGYGRHEQMLTTAILERACAETAHLLNGSSSIRFVTVNLSSSDVVSPWLTDAVRGALASSGIDPASLVLELNEALEIDDEVLSVMAELRAMGMKLLIDDWGKKATTLDQVRLPVNGLKLDRSLLTEAHDEVGNMLVSSIVEIARRLDLVVVAEGIETADDFEMATKLGCHLLQGYWIGKPVPIEETLLLASREAGLRDVASSNGVQA